MHDHIKMSSRERTILTCVTYFGYTTMGMTVSMIGPTLVNLEQLFDTNTAILGYALTLTAAGMVMGSALCAGIFDRFPNELLLACAFLCEACTISLAPQWNLTLYMVMLFLKGISTGFLQAGSNAYFINLWKDHNNQQKLMLLFQLFYSVGGFLAPYMANPFLVDPTQYINRSAKQDSTTHEPEVDTVRYPYVLCGAFCGIAGIAFGICYMIGMRKPILHNKKSQAESASEQTHASFIRLTFNALVLLLFLLNQCNQSSYSMFVTTVAVKGFGWSITIGSLLTSLFFLAGAIGMFVYMFLSHFFNMQNILISCILTAVAANVMMLFTPQLGLASFIIAEMVSFTALGPTQPAAYLWLSQHFPISGAMSGICIAGLSSGKILAYSLTAYTIETFSHMWLLYIVLGTSVLMVLVFTILCTMLRLGYIGMETEVVTQTMHDEKNPLLKTSHEPEYYSTKS